MKPNLKLPWTHTPENAIHDANGRQVGFADGAAEVVRRVNAHDALVAALEAYGSHRFMCSAAPGDGGKCTCGLDAALAAAKGAS